ncbi:hypothetical protein [Streptomyces sp. CoH17]|uniref:hypothetical protein n=1 Tax=Streptomyces sp. CoH17 TaxID=2992806 RepID=UPI00226DDA39|nr:hypothetical protein [Streptomyces sp. CoH17]
MSGEDEYEVGFGYIAESIERATARRAQHYEMYGWKPDGEKMLRILHLPMNTYWHENVRCNDGGYRDFPHTEKGVKKSLQRPCVICAGEIIKPPGKKYGMIERGIALAALRKQSFIEKGGKRIPGAIIDTRTTHTPDGDGQQYVGLLKFANSNFWGNLSGVYARNKTLMDRDFKVKRIGGGYDTYYSFEPQDPIEGLKTKEELEEHYKELLKDKPTIFEWFDEQCSQEYFDQYLKAETPEQEEIMRTTGSVKEKSQTSGTGMPQPEREEEVSHGVQAPRDTSFSSLKEQLKSQMDSYEDDDE